MQRNRGKQQLEVIFVGRVVGCNVIEANNNILDLLYGKTTTFKVN